MTSSGMACEVRWSLKERNKSHDWVIVYASNMRSAAHDFVSSQFDSWGWEHSGDFCCDLLIDVRLSEHAPIHEYIVTGGAEMVFTPAYKGVSND